MWTWIEDLENTVSKERGRLVDLRYVGFDGYKVSKTARRRELLEHLERISCAYFY